jgi:hypothetical protein
MAYIIRNTAGALLGTGSIADGTIDDRAATSLQLVGRNYSNYGQIMTDNLIRMLENFAYGSAPSNPLAGQLWWNTADSRLRVYTGSTFKIVSSCTAQSTPPSTTVAGDLWWDSSEEQMYVYNGTSPYTSAGWILVGPQTKKTRGKSGATWEQITDNTTAVHDVLGLWLNGVRTAIISTDSDFTPAAGIIGFNTVKQGLTANASVNLGQYFITANNANYLGDQPALNYLRSDIDDVTAGTFTINNNGGLTLGLNSNLTITTNSSGHANIRNTRNNGDINFYANVSGTNTLAFGIDGATGTASLLSAILSGGLTLASGATVTGALNVTGTGSFSGNLTAPTQSAGTADTTVATTAFVINNSGFLTNKIYAPGITPSASNTYVEVNDTGSGNLKIAIDGTTVATGTSSGFSLSNGAVAVTQSDTYNGSGNARVATTQFVKTATTWWGGSAKFVSTDEPVSGVNDAGSNDGDFWFQRES